MLEPVSWPRPKNWPRRTTMRLRRTRRRMAQHARRARSARRRAVGKLLGHRQDRRRRHGRGRRAVIALVVVEALARPGGPLSRARQLGLDSLRRLRVDDCLLALHLHQPGQLGLAVGVGLVALLGDRDAVVAGHLAGRILLIVRGVQALGHQPIAARQPGPGDRVTGRDLDRGGEAGPRALDIALREGRAAIPHQRHRLLRRRRSAGRHARSCWPARGLWSAEDFTGRGPLAVARSYACASRPTRMPRNPSS